jgi:eukaryotic-like serine/threonine-protein kinase
MRAAMWLLAMLFLLPAAQGQSMFRGDAAHSGIYASAAPRQMPRVKWSFPTGARIVSSPVWADGAVIFGSDDGNVYAVDAATGRQRWMRRTGGPVPSTPAVAGGVVYVVSYDSRLHALDLGTGEPVWTYRSGGERRFEARGLHGLQPRHQTIADPFDVFLSSPVVAQGLVVFGSGDGKLHAVDAATGAARWSFATGDVVHGSPAYADGVLYVGSWDSRVYAVDAATGRERWRYQGGEDALLHNQVGFQSSPAVTDGIVYIGGRDSKLHAIDARTGQERWTFPTGMSWVISSPAVARGRVIFGTSDSSEFHMVDARSGASLVKEPAQAYMFGSAAVAGDVVLMGVLNGTLQARDFDSGKLLWRFTTEAAQRNRGWVLTADGAFNGPMIFSSDWREAALAATELQFSVGSFFSSPLVVGGVIYIGSADGRLYALE